MKKWLYTFMIRALCMLLLISTFPGAAHISYAAPQTISYQNMGSHDNQSGYVPLGQYDPMFVGYTSAGSLVQMAYGEFQISPSGFPAPGKKAVLQVKITNMYNSDPTTFPPSLSVWQYTGSPTFDPYNGGGSDSVSWPPSVDSMRSNLTYKLLGTQSGDQVKAGATLTFDVDAAVKSAAGGSLVLLFTGPEGASKNGVNRLDLYTAPVLTEVSLPASASQSTVAVSKSTVAADGTDSANVTVTAKDANGNALSDKTVTLAKGSDSSTISPVQAVTGADGTAVFKVTDTKLEQATYTASIAEDNITIAQTGTVTFQVGAVSASQSTVSVSKATVSADNTDSATVTVTLQDGGNHAISGQAVTLSQGSGSSSITAIQGTTDASGTATFTVQSKKAESVTYSATANGVTLTGTASVTFQPGAPNVANSTISMSKTSVNADGIDSSTVTVTVMDANGNPVSGRSIALSQSGNSSITAVNGNTTNASGQVTFTVKNTKVEAIIYTANIAGYPMGITANSAVTFNAGALNDTSSTVTTSTPNVFANNFDYATISVTLKDANKNPISGQAVVLSQGSGSSTIRTIQGTTNSSGVARFTVKSTKAETVTYTATTGGTTLTATTAVTFRPGTISASASKVTVSKANVTADGTDSSTITVTLTDANSNPLSGKVVTLAQVSGSGGATVTASNGTTTDASGQVVFTVTGTKVGAVTYAATDATDKITLTGTGAVTFIVGAVNAALSNVAVSKTKVIADNTDSATITVTLHDSQSNLISGTAVTLSQGDGSSTITAVQGMTDSSGVATFTVKSNKVEAVNYTVTAGGITLTNTASVTFQSAVVSASASKVSVSKANVMADGTDSSTITVTLTDDNGNPFSGKHVTLSQGSGSSLITPLSGATTDASGQAVFTVTSTKAEAVTYTATDTTDNILLTNTGTVTFNAGTMNALLSSVTVSKTTVTADNTDSATVTVTLRDSQSNLISGKTVTLSQGGGSSTIKATQSTTNASGVATFTVNSTKAESVTYTAAVDSVSLSLHPVPVTFTAAAASASMSTVTVSNANAAADGTDSSTITVTLKDTNSNPVSGKVVQLSQASGSSVIAPATAITTNASGQAIFMVTNTKAEKVTYTATDVTDSITLTGTGAVTFAPSSVNAALSTVAISKNNAIADNTDSATITVTLRDSQSNLISGKTVTLSQGSGGSVINATQGTTDSSGVATFTVKSTKAESVTYTASVGNVTLSLHPVPITFTAGAASAALSSITVSKASASANGADAATVTVTVKDQYGNVVTGQAVSLQQGSSSSLISPAQATTDVAGQASFTVTNTQAGNVVYTANAITANVTLSGTVNVNFLSTNANLSAVQLSAGVLIPTFIPAQTSYLASVQNDVYDITVTPTTSDSNATVRVNGNMVPSGSASAPISLQTGTNTVTVDVIAADGQTRQTYTIQVIREPNKDARLQALIGSSAALTPAFDPAITQYTVNVDSSVDRYSVQADVYNPLSTVTVTGATYDSSKSTYATSLQFGTNTMKLNVTAQDGQTSTIYTVNVIRAKALDELKDALDKLAIGYTGNESSAFVSSDLSLPTMQDGLAVTWSSSQPQFVQANGKVTRPTATAGDATVTLTATITHNGVQLSHTFLLIVRSKIMSMVVAPTTRTGTNQTPITRIVLSDGSKVDTATVGAAQLSSALQSAMQTNTGKVSLHFNDTSSNSANELLVDIPRSAYKSLANKVDLNVGTSDAQVTLSKSTLSQLENAGQSLSFSFAPVDQTNEASAVTKQAINDPLVQQTVGNSTVTPVGTPITVETNYHSYNTTLTFPASKLNLPPGSAAQQAAYAAGLYVYIQHSDGEIALQRGTVQLDANGQVTGIAIQINKFSTFTVLNVQAKSSSSSNNSSSGGGGSSSGSGTSGSNSTNGNNSTNGSNGSNTTPTPTPSSSATPAPSGTTGEHQAYINGYPDHTFRPSQTTTRAELAAMLWRIMQTNGSQPVANTAARYSDVPATHWASAAIRQLQAQHIMMGAASDQFAPNRPLTRAEFATLAVRWQKLTATGADNTVSFTDVKGHWAAPSIAVLIQMGVVKGYSDGTFHPNKGVTRAELVTMMNRLLKRGPLTGITTSKWQDVPVTYWAFGDIEEASLTHKYQLLSDGAEQWVGN
ncbi:Ig-like domain-containing protein [Paenibacillus sp. SGZ-1009]|uniref:Ig-like domain-containing protein n=1 Tax=Paenibacillus campi TaxID=3106031 RepID=UPI002AFDF433|nr:Ig-like domain-containing protein [Paenibacillus sp. SGZ-1009]